MRPSDIHNSIKKLKLKASVDMDCRVHGGIDEALSDLKHTSPVSEKPRFGRMIMKSPVFKLSIAAILIVGVVLIFNMGESVTLARVIEPILGFRTIALDLVVGDEQTSPVVHDVIKGHRIRRTLSNSEMIMVLDLQEKTMLSLDPQSQSASYVDIEGMVAVGTHKLLELVKTIVSDIEENPDLIVQELGRRDFNGLEAVGFELGQPGTTIRLWADPVTATPKRIELSMGKEGFVLKNIEFDIKVDDALLSMEIPAGYTHAEQTMTLGEGTEEDLTTTLGFWAEHVNQGFFPDAFGVSELMEILPQFTATIEGMELSKDQEMQIGQQYGQALIFIQVITAQKGQWHYGGKGVALGDAQTAVFWYRQGDSKSYRVIYGDLHAEDVPLDRIPQ